MKQKNLLRIALLLLLAFTINQNIKAQSAGDIAFVGFNADGGDDFAIVILTDLSINTKIWFTDSEPTGANTIDSGEGKVEWDSGNTIIKAGNIVIFNDFSSSATRTTSRGSLTDASGSFNLAIGGDALFAYTGNATTVTTWLAGIQNKAGNEGANLADTGLIAGSTFINFYTSGSPDAGFFTGSRSSSSNYSDYLLIIGNNANWDSSIGDGDGDTVLPFSQEAFTINTTNWTGASSNVWNLAGNWDNGIPTEDSNVVIPVTSNNPVINSSLNTGNITINSNASLTITGSISNKGLTTINSDATILATGTLSGIVKFNRALASAGQWYYMSSPVIGENYDTTWATANSVATSSINSNNIGVSLYDNTSSDADTDYWRYLQSDNSNSTTFNAGQGYSIILSSPATVSFIGTGIYTTSQTRAITTSASNFNLVGNPFTAYLNLGDFFADNPVTTVLESTDAYFWNGSGYDTKTSGLHGDFEIAPGQGFFVEAAANTNLTFDIADVTHQSTPTFQKSGSRPEINLFVTDGSTNKYANIYYIDGTTTGFDNGYDGKLFGGVAHSFALYTHLVSDSEGKNFQLQSLPNSNHESMVIPVGVNAATGKEITFTADAMNLPENINVYLEDKELNTYTKLNEANASYKVTLTTAANGIGRFYLHTSAKSTLSATDVALENISVYKTTNSTLRVVGLSEGKAKLKLFNLLGKEVVTTTFNTTGIKDITLPKLATGIYIVQLETEKGTLNKKITLE